MLVVTCRGEIREGIPTLCDWTLECGLCWGGAMAEGAKYYGGGVVLLRYDACNQYYSINYLDGDKEEFEGLLE